MRHTLKVDSETLQDILYLYTGLYAPLNGFMTEDEYRSVVDTMYISPGKVWPLPVTLAVPEELCRKIQTASILDLAFGDSKVGFIEISGCYSVNAQADCEKIFKTGDRKHPGVRKELDRSPHRIGGLVTVENEVFLDNVLRPEKTTRLFASKGWKTVVGFQTRNPVHRAHEYLQRTGLELCDGLFINPSIGWKKAGDFTEAAIDAAYGVMLKEFYPQDRVYFEGFRSYFRYAGPREAVYHAILRKNLGCTHFIIGRDHAGIGNYYGQYEAHEVAGRIAEETDLGIELLLTHEPYFCHHCNQIVTEKHCTHDKNEILRISGTEIRSMLKKGLLPDDRMIRPEIAQALIELEDNLFVE